MAKLELIIDGSKAKQGHADWRAMMADIKAQGTAGAAGIEAINKSLDVLSQELRQSKVMIAGFNAVLAGLDKQSDATSQGMGVLASYILDLTSEARVSNQILWSLNQTVSKLGTTSTATAPQVRATASAVDTLEKSTSRAERVLVTLHRQLYAVVGGFTAFQAIRSAYRAVTEFEDGMVQVVRTAEIAGKDIGRLAEQIENLSQKSPVSTTRLLEIATAAGQLGVTGVENIVEFTDTIARLETSTNLKGEAAAIALARILNVTGEAPDRVNVLGAAITKLDASVAATAAEIAHISTEVALATTVFKLSSTEVTAIGAALATLGVQAENAGSSIGRVYRALDQAVRNGGATMEIVTNVTGKTQEQFRDIFRTNATEGFRIFLEGLAQVEEKGQDTIKVLDSLALSDLRILKSIQPLASNYETLANTLKIAGEQAKEPIALIDASARVWNTFSSHMKVARNDVVALVRHLGNEAAPAIVTFTSAFRELVDPQYEATGASAVLADSIRRLTVITAAYMALRLPLYMSSIVTATSAATGAIRTMTLAMARNPMGILIAGAAIAIGSMIDLESHTNEATDSVEKFAEAARRLKEHLESFDKIKRTFDFGIQKGDLELQARGIQQQISAIEEVINGMSLGPQGSTTWGDRLLKYFQLNPGVQAKIQTEIDKQIKQMNDANKEALRRGELSRSDFAAMNPQPSDTYFMRSLELLEAELLRLKDVYKDLQKTISEGPPTDPMDKGEIGARDDARESLEKYGEELKREARLIKASGVEHAVLLATYKTEDLQRVAMMPGFRMYQAQLIAAVVANYKLKESIDATKKADDDRAKAIENVRDLIKQTYTKADVAGLSEQARDRTVALRTAEEELRKAFGETSGSLRVRMVLLAELSKALDKLAEADDRATLSQKNRQDRERRDKQAEAAGKELDKRTEEMQFEIQNASKIQALRREQNMTYEEAKGHLMALVEARRLYNIAFQDSPEKEALIESSMADYERLEVALRTALNLSKAFDDAGKAGANALEEIAIEGEHLDEVLSNLWKDLQRIAFRQFVSQPFANFIGGLVPTGGEGLVGPNYLGGVFKGSDVVPFAGGGVVSGLTEFPLSGGRKGRMAEGHREEAIMPLERDSSGKLGVAVTGGAGAGQTVNVHLHITTNDPDTIRRSKGQIFAAAQSAAARAFRRS